MCRIAPKSHRFVLRIRAVVALCLCVTAQADWREDANAAFKKEDFATMARVVRPAAEQGVAKAQFSLGTMYYNGKGVLEDYAEAVILFRLSAEQGNTWAQRRLGTMYESGKSVPRDYIQAHKWYNLSASRHKGSVELNRATSLRDNIAALMTSAQIAEAQKLARQWDKAHPR
jgi:uncharacterized protein